MNKAIVLLCSNCEELLKVESNGLVCKECGKVYNKLSSGYFDFRLGGEQPEQDRGLKSHMEFDFYCNGKFQHFLANKNLQNLKGVLRSFQHETVLDIGCSSGVMYCVLDECDQYYGCDPSDIEQISSYAKSDSAFLIHNDVEKPFPIAPKSMDCVALFASYDHLPEPGPVIKDAWQKLKPGGHLLINMTNYGFWLKALINKFSGKQLFKNEHEHYCVHSPKTLEEEIESFVPEATLLYSESDFVYLPNVPKKLSFIYFSSWWIHSLEKVTNLLFHKIFRLKERGSLMTLVFQKPEDSK